MTPIQHWKRDRLQWIWNEGIAELIRVKGLPKEDVENHEIKTWHEEHLKEKT